MSKMRGFWVRIIAKPKLGFQKKTVFPKGIHENFYQFCFDSS